MNDGSHTPLLDQLRQRAESVLLEFEPAAIDEPALEDLARFVLGESKAFLHRAPLAHVNSRRA